MEKVRQADERFAVSVDTMQSIDTTKTLAEIAKDSAVVFISEDGQYFQLFMGGQYIAVTNGVKITAGGGDVVKVGMNVDVLHLAKRKETPMPKME